MEKVELIPHQIEAVSCNFCRKELKPGDLYYNLLTGGREFTFCYGCAEGILDLVKALGREVLIKETY